MKGMRQQPQSSKKEKMRSVEAEMKNTQMALRINQMMVQQLMENNKKLAGDLGQAMGLISELQYKVLAIQSVANLDIAALSAVANDKRLVDFNEASALEDARANNAPGAAVNEDSIITITSTTEGEDKGIFRSKFALSDCGVPELVAAFSGREAGAKAIVSLNGVEHTVELLAVVQPPKAEPVPQVPLQVVPNLPEAEQA